MNPLPKTINAFILAQYGCIDTTHCPTLQGGQTISDYLTHNYLDGSVGSSYWAEQVAWLIVTWCVFRIMTILALKYICYLKR